MDSTRINIKKINPNATLPAYQTKYSAGMDIFACIDKPLSLDPMDRAMIPSGVAVELPVGFELQIRARSSFGLKYGVTMANGVGTIDSDYRGEISVVLINLGQEKFVVEPNMRIAQAVISRHEHIIWNEVDELDQTERGTGGFGSTGKK